VDFSSSTTLSLAPHSAYVIAATEAPNGNDDNALRFGYSESYSVASDWQLYPAQNDNQWYLDPEFGWVDESPDGLDGMVLEVNATPVPEPTALGLLVAGAAVISRRTHRRK
jgi:hypothetical protein